MENFGTIMEVYLIEMENKIRKQILEEISLQREEEQKKIWLNKSQLANYLGVCFKTLDKFVKDNPSFPSTNIAGATRYNCNRVDEWMEIHDEMVKNKKRQKAS